MDAYTQISAGVRPVSSVLQSYSSEMEKSLSRIATGLRIQSPADDSGNYFRAQDLEWRADSVAEIGRELQVHLSRLETAQDTLTSMQEMVEDMADLAKKASNEDDASVRASYGADFDELASALNDMAQNTTFEGIAILDGSFDVDAGGTRINAQVEEDVEAVFRYEILDTRPYSATGLDISVAATTAETDWADAATGKTSADNMYTLLTETDAGMQRLERNLSRISTNNTVIDAANNQMENKQANYLAAKNALVGVNEAEEISRFSALQIRQQAAAAFLAQSNSTYGTMIGLLSGYHSIG